LQRGELAIDRTQNTEIRHILSAAMSDPTADVDKFADGCRTSDDQLMNINSRITCTAAKHCALVESQLLESKSSSASCSSVSYSDSCGDSKDLNHCDPESAVKDCLPPHDAGVDVVEPIVDAVDLSNSTLPADEEEGVVPTGTGVN
jgi:hypothetical protein